VFLLYLDARLLEEPAGARAFGAVAAIAAGVALAWVPPQPGHAHAGTAPVLAVLIPLIALAGLPWRGGRRTPGELAVVGGGAGCSATALTTKLVAEAPASAHWPAALGGAVLAAAPGVSRHVDDAHR
jgi:hypothetical protein